MQATARTSLLAAILLAAAGCMQDDVPDNAASDTVVVAGERFDPPNGFTIYRNERFDYSVAYPDTLLIPRGEAANGDGQHFISSDSTVFLTAFGRHVAPDDSVGGSFRARLAELNTDDGVVTYSTKSDSTYVVSGTTGEWIYYEKSIFYDSTMARIELTYTIPMREAMDSVVTHVSHSFGGRIW